MPFSLEYLSFIESFEPCYLFRIGYQHLIHRTLLTEAMQTAEDLFLGTYYENVSDAASVQYANHSIQTEHSKMIEVLRLLFCNPAIVDIASKEQPNGMDMSMTPPETKGLSVAFKLPVFSLFLHWYLLGSKLLGTAEIPCRYELP